MTAPVDLILAEIPLDPLRQDAVRWESFLRVQQPWIAAGVTRWLGLVLGDGPWPVFVVAAWSPESPAELLGTVVGVWAPAPLTRFDDLLETSCPGPQRGNQRPRGGTWHFIAATVSPHAEGLNLGRRLVGAALTWMETHAPDASARTLSPAVGLPRLIAQLPTPASLTEAVLHLANAQGQPALEILRLHLGAGATLDAILPDSRRDEVRSGRVTLRFAYSTDPDAREAQKQRYKAWIARRAAAVAAGAAQQLTDGPLWRVADARDDEVAPLSVTRTSTALP